GSLEINRVDRGIVGELFEADDSSGFNPDFLDVFLFNDNVMALLELVPLDELGVRDLALAVRAPPLLLNTRLAFGVQLVEAQRGAGVGGWKYLNRNVDEADLEIAFPSWSCRHGASTIHK